MRDKQNYESILMQIASLRGMETKQLRDKWVELNGSPPPPYNRKFLIRRISHRIQELAFGGLSETTKKKLDDIANNKVFRDESIPIPGTKLIREHRGVRHQVTVLEDGYEYNGCKYDNLSVIATKITGTKWSGPVFFGLKK